MKTIIAIALILAVAFSAPPIPDQPDGFVYSNPSNGAPLATLDVYEDLLCIDCKHFEPAFKQYLNTHTINNVPVTEYLKTTIHLFPLPYHHHAFFTAQLAAFVASQNNNVTEYFQFSDWIFEAQEEFNAGSVSLTAPQVQAKLCSEASAALDFLAEADCLNEFSNNAHNNDARISFKLASYYGVNGTPTLFLNGVEVDPPLTTQGWINLLAPYLPSEDTLIESALNEIAQ